MLTYDRKRSGVAIPSERQSYKFPSVALYSIIRYAFGAADKRSFLDGCVVSCVTLFQRLRLLVRVPGWSWARRLLRYRGATTIVQSYSSNLCVTGFMRAD